MLPANFELLVNPPQERWNEIVAQIHDELSWKMSFHDYPSFREGFGDNFSFLVALDKSKDRVAACVGGNVFPKQNGSPELFTIGMYYTHPGHRQDGLGRKLFMELVRIGNGRNMFLNAAPAMAKKYAERSGFDKFAPWELVCFVAEAKQIDLSKLTVHPAVNVVDFKDVDFNNLDKYDQSIGAGVPRGKFLEKWLTQPAAFNKFAVDSDGQILGYCNARVVCGNHIMIGPFYAESPKIAETILKQTLETVPDFSNYNQLVGYMSSENLEGQAIFKKMVNGEVNTDRRMPRQFDNKIIATSGKRVYAITETDLSLV